MIRDFQNNILTSLSKFKVNSVQNGKNWHTKVVITFELLIVSKRSAYQKIALCRGYIAKKTRSL